MMRGFAAAAALALAACSQPATPTVAANLQPCGELQLTTGELTPAECQIQAAGQTLHVTFAEPAAGMQSGAITVDVLGDDGHVQQTFTEPDVSEYDLAPSVEDVDGDGRADILVPRVSGNVNTEWGVWIFDGTRYERVGTLDGVQIERTADGFIAAPARSSCCSWNVRYYRLDDSGLHHLVTAQIDGEEETPGGAVRATCSISEAPGLGDLHLSQDAAREKFCAEPASQVFGP
jgi:hypothetical protein